jgi:Fe-S-cluster containining protein
MAKQCGTCTKCCDGSALRVGTINENIIPDGTPCIFLDQKNKKCSDYDNRPQFPCKEYMCMWLEFEDVPIWMKPEYSDIIVSHITFNNNNFLWITPFKMEYSAKSFSYVIEYAKKNNMNVIYQSTKYGSLKFIGNNNEIIDLILHSQQFYEMFKEITHDKEIITKKGFIKYLPLTIK